MKVIFSYLPLLRDLSTVFPNPELQFYEMAKNASMNRFYWKFVTGFWPEKRKFKLVRYRLSMHINSRNIRNFE